MVGGIFTYWGYSKLTKGKEIKTELFTKAGFKNPKGITVIMGILESVIGLGLIFGIYTQLFALLGAVIMVFAIKFKNKFPENMAESKLFYFTLFVILISLILTGAGGLAFDIGL